MTGLAALTEEHRAIEGMLGVLETVAERLDRQARVPQDVVDGTLVFLQTMADGVHHAKEERVLFPLLVKHDFGPEQPFVNALMEHHGMGRAYVRRMKELWRETADGRPGASEAFASQARSYIELMREHIRIEDEFLVSVSNDHLSEADQAELTAGFDMVDQERRAAGWVPQCRDDIARYLEALAEA